MVFSDGAPGFGRTLGAAPFVVMLPALGMAAAVEWSPQSGWATAAVVVSIVASAAWNMRNYFGLYPQQPGLFDAFEIGLWRLNQSAAEAAQTGPAYLVLDEANLQHPGTRLTRELAQADLRVINGQTCWAYPEVLESPGLFAVLPQWSRRVEALFPGARPEAVLHEPEPYAYGLLYRLPAGMRATGGRTALAEFGGVVELLRVGVPPAPVQPGDSVSIELQWRAIQPVAVRYTVFVHLVTPDNPFWAGADAEPCQGWYPTSAWHGGEVVEYNMPLSLPPDLPPGTYDVAAGMYDWTTGERLAVTQPGGRESDRAFAAVLVVR
jgi:hypothetical protein